MMRIHHGVVASLVVVTSSALLAVVGPAAAVSCGDTLSGTVKLHADLDCTGTGQSPALTLAAGARLDLSRHTVTCSDASSDGIALLTSHSKLQVGSVAGCARGVVVGGTGGHFIGTMTVSGSATGFAVLSSGNRLQLNISAGNTVGVSVSGDDNDLIGNQVSGGTTGIAITSDDNLVKGNRVDGASVGIAVIGDANKLQNNLTLGNGTGMRLLAPATLNSSVTHTAQSNTTAGIEVDSGATGNTIAKSKASGNGIDLVDGNPTCVDIWQKNTAPTTTSSGPAGCIK